MVIGFFKIFKYTFFNILESGHAKKLCYVFWRFVSVLFFNIWKRPQAKDFGSLF